MEKDNSIFYMDVKGKKVRIPKLYNEIYKSANKRNLEEMFKELYIHKNYASGKITDDMINYMIEEFFKHGINDSDYHWYIHYLFKILESDNFYNQIISFELFQKVVKLLCDYYEMDKDERPQNAILYLNFILIEGYPNILLTDDEFSSIFTTVKNPRKNIVEIILKKLNCNLDEELEKKLEIFKSYVDRENFDFESFRLFLKVLISKNFLDGKIKKEHLCYVLDGIIEGLNENSDSLFFEIPKIYYFMHILKCKNYSKIPSKVFDLFFEHYDNYNVRVSVMIKFIDSKYFEQGQINVELFLKLLKSSPILINVINYLLGSDTFSLEDRFYYAFCILEKGDKEIDTYYDKFTEQLSDYYKGEALYRFPKAFVDNYMFEFLGIDNQRGSKGV